MMVMTVGNAHFPLSGGGVDWYGGKAATIAPGDTIYYSFWIKTSAPTITADIDNPQAGGRIGIDIYGSGGDICDFHSRRSCYM